MDTKRPNMCVRESLDLLAKLLGESYTDCEARWTAKMNQSLDRLEQALSAEALEPLTSEFFEEIAQAHPRLISLCANFHENGRRLLRQAAVVLLLSARRDKTGKPAVRELHKATALLIDAVKRHETLESELVGEAARDIGGEG
jgi:hypothetical protein